MTYVGYGRCKSGKRWFWVAEAWNYDGITCECGEPGCPGFPHEHGWEGTEEQAVRAMSEAVARLGGEFRTRGCYPGNAPGRAGQAANALKRINAARKAARPAKGEETRGAPVEYLYAPNFHYDDMDGQRRWVSEIPVAKKTPRRIYFDNSGSYDRFEGTHTLAYFSREEFESDTRCTGKRGYQPDGSYIEKCPHGRYGDHGEAAGEIQLGISHYTNYHLFATREAAEDYLYSGERQRERERQQKRKQAAPDIKVLRRAMAAAHPDRGGTNEEFIAAREQYERALAEVTT